MTMDPILWITFAVALAFDFVNGFHDAANSIATIVSTRVLTPRMAVVWAAFFNFIAAFTFGVTVAMTVGKGVVVTDEITVPVILSGLVGAVTWNLITWWLGLPSSSSHALVGGLAGAAVVHGGFELLIPEGLAKIAAFIVLSPFIGMILALFVQVIVYNLARHRSPHSLTPLFKRLQLVSAAIYSFSHGTNDAQKTMGILFAVLVSGGYLQTSDDMPVWIQNS